MYRTSALALSLGLVVGQTALGQTVETYENSGIVTTPPQIDARNFINKGQFFATNGFLRTYYYPYNTLNYTNQGTMVANVGFEFKTVPTGGGQKRPAQNFVNANGAQVAVAGNIEIGANKVINRGTLSSGSSGRITVTADNADLSRSVLQSGFYNYSSSANASIFTDFWSLDGAVLNFGSFGDFFGLSPLHEVQTVDGSGSRILSISAFDEVYARTTTAEPGEKGETTNYFQVVYLNLPVDSKAAERLGHEFTFFREFQDDPDNPGELIPVDPYEGGFAPVAVDWFTSVTNPWTGEEIVVDLSFSDDFAENTNNVRLIQEAIPPYASPTYPRQVFRPSNFEFERSPTALGNVIEEPVDMVPTMVHPVSPDAIRSSSWAVSSFPSALRHDTNVLDTASMTNLPGRIEITTGNLDLNFTRIQAENFLSIKATNNFAGSFRSQINTPFSQMELATTNAVLKIDDLLVDELPFVVGQVRAYSSYWSRKYKVGDIDMEDNYAVTIIDASRLKIAHPQILDLSIRADNLVLNDHLNVGEELLLDCASLTISNSGRLNITSERIVWSDSLPRLTSLTNLGIISSVTDVKFMQDSQPNLPEGAPYEWFVNQGTIDVGGMTVAAQNLEQSGSISTRFGDADLRFGNATVSNAIISVIGAAGSVELTGNNLTMLNTTIFANDRVSVAVDGILNDGGSTGNNIWYTSSGFDLSVKPAAGNLLGTTLWTFGDEFSEVETTWAGEDRGLSGSGFENNAAVGNLWLDGGFGTLFTFRPATGQNAIYVENLALTEDVQMDLQYAFSVDPNFTIYFRNLWTLNSYGDGTADLSPSLVKPIELELATGGRFRSMAGGRAAVNLRNAQGQVIGSIDVDLALRNSSTIDSDADGVVNQADDYPFDGPVLRSAAAANGKVTLTWNAAANTKYTLWTTQNFTNWTQVTEITSGPLIGPVQVEVPASANGSTFKLSYTP